MSGFVIPAQAGIHNLQRVEFMDSRLRGNDIWGWLLAILLALVVAVPAHAQTFPTLTGRVVDAANIIPDAEEAALDAKLKVLEDSTDRQLVVATIASLEGYPIDDYGYRLGRAWGIGQKESNNGAILIIAPNDRKLRVEVGYGLEPILTDAWSSVLINTVIVPQFKANNYPGGIAAGVDAVIAQLQLPPEEAAKRAAQASKQSSRQNSGVSMGDIIFWLVIFFFFILPVLRAMFGKRGRRYGNGPVIIWGGGGDSWGSGSSGGSSWGDSGGGFSGGGGDFGGGGASGDW